MLNKKQGFTLIELLVVIAIIGILLSAVLASLSVIRTRGFDAAVKENLVNIRSQAELYHINNDNYGDDVSGGCSVVGTIFVGDPVIANAILAIFNANGGNALTCMSDDGIVTAGTVSDTWAVSSPLQGGGSWCVDSFRSSFSGTAQIISNVALCQ